MPGQVIKYNKSEVVKMYTKQDLKAHLQAMGLVSTDAVMLHSSMKAIGAVEGGADTVVDAFMEYLSEGLFMTPAHTWAQMSETHACFDPAAEPACVGIIPNLFLKRPGVVRSLHPTHSIAAAGPMAAEYVRGEEKCTTPCSPGGCWDRLRHIHAKILLAGVTHSRNTFIHSIEEVLEVPERFTPEPAAFQIKMPGGSMKEVRVYRHYNPHTAHISESFDKLSEAFYAVGAAEKVSFGQAECILCDAEGLFDVTCRVLSHELNCLMDRERIPEQWWEGAFIQSGRFFL